MTQSIDELRNSVLDQFTVLEDDIHLTSDEDAITFYLPTDELDQAQDSLAAKVEVLEEYDREYLIKAAP
jgi:hypothetical protein